MEFTIKISAADIVLIGNLLQEQPYKNVSRIINLIQAQIDEQQQAAIAEASVAAAPQSPEPEILVEAETAHDQLKEAA